MSRRQLRTTEGNIRRSAATLIQPKLARAFLLDPYPGNSGAGGPQVLMVSLSDPLKGTRGTVLRARVRSGTSSAALPVGTPVTLQTTHGQAEIVSFG